jgi:hypothetical protein
LGFWPSDFVPNPDLAAAERELWLISWPLGSLDAIVPGWMRYRLNYYWFRESLDFPAIKPWGAEPSLEYKTTSRGGQGPLGMVLKPGNSLDSAPKAEKIPLSSGIYASIAAQCGGRNPRPRSPVAVYRMRSRLGPGKGCYRRSPARIAQGLLEEYRIVLEGPKRAARPMVCRGAWRFYVKGFGKMGSYAVAGHSQMETAPCHA